MKAPVGENRGEMWYMGYREKQIGVKWGTGMRRGRE